MKPLKELHQQVILSGFVSVHERLAEMEAFLAEGANPTPFSRYFNDLSPTELKVVRDYFARLRAIMESWLKEAGIPIDVRRSGLRWVLQCGLNFVDITVAEIGPNKLVGYGKLDEADRAEIVKMQADLERVLSRVGNYLSGRGGKFSQRMAALHVSGIRKQSLTLLDEVVARWQLVEFRPLLDFVVERLESPQFEIAVFGRVSSGKSSLLNHIAGETLLPVGVTPVTAVPTRLALGPRPQATVTFAELGSRNIPVEELAEYAAEERNPGNEKHVTRILVRFPSPRLREGVTFVDTPGVGSLATAGSAETLYYLPRCDLGLVLVDAGSSLDEDDLRLLRSLREAGISAQVLLSKADLLSLADRERAIQYIRKHVGRDLGADLPVHPVSTIGEHEILLNQWFDAELEPRLKQSQELAQESLLRKVATLLESTAAILDTMLARHSGSGGEQNDFDVGQIKSLLDETDVAVRQAQANIQDWLNGEGVLVGRFFDALIERDVARRTAAPESEEIASALGASLQQRGIAARELINSLHDRLNSTLESLQHSGVFTGIDVSAVRECRPTGLPIPQPINNGSWLRKATASWWAMVPSIAAPLLRRSMESRLSPLVREKLESYDRQLRAWLRANSSQLIDLYELQADVVREQLRRVTSGKASREALDTAQLQKDLAALHKELEAYLSVT